jgi:endonuclease/exonuclease/phosphatase family metal-dependent hydrolase
MTAGRLQKLRHRLSVFIWVASWVFLAFLIVAASLIHGMGDSSWPLTLLTFSPRWISLMPLAPLAIVALAIRRSALVPLLLCLGCALGPVMGFCVPWRSMFDHGPENSTLLRVVSVNVDRGTDLAALFRFLDEVDPDVIAFQEGAYIAPVLKELKGKFQTAGTHDTFVASRYRIVDSAASPEGTGRHHPSSVRCDIATPAGVVHVHCVHLCTLRAGFDAMIHRRLRGVPELEHVTSVRDEGSRLAAEFAKQTEGPTVILGDFNMTNDSTVFQRDWGAWQDAFSLRGFGLGYTFASTRIRLRIDHVLADRRHWYIRSCRVGPDLHGQHRPLVAELLLIEPVAVGG